MTLNRIVDMVINIEEGLMCGYIEFEYDNLMCALKPGHPMEILDKILSEIFWDVQAGREPSQEALKNTLRNFKAFRDTFKVEEMKKPIDALETYLNPTKKYHFQLMVGDTAKATVIYPACQKDFDKMVKANSKGIPLQEAAGLKTLYKKILAEAMKKQKNKALADKEVWVDYPKEVIQNT